MTHDYKRNGVTTFYAAMDVQSGIVIGACKPRHRAREFIAFLRRIDRCVQRLLDVHVALDNSATHKTPEVKAWLEKYARLYPTSASWVNLVERFFAEITRKRIRRGAFASVAAPERGSQAVSVDKDGQGHPRERATRPRGSRNRGGEPSDRVRTLEAARSSRKFWPSKL